MNERKLRKALAGVPFGDLLFFEQTGSTNDVALAWAASDAPDLALVYAEEQTAGRGRGDHQWFASPGAALMFSLVLRPRAGEEQSVPLFSALGALAVCRALEALGLHPEIKWPNDVLLSRRKVCGILAESVWTGETVDSIVLGIGVNVEPEAVPPPDQLDFPATCLKAECAGQGLRESEPCSDRLALLREILLSIIEWRGQMATDAFRQAWEGRLAFRGERVAIWDGERKMGEGQVEGLGEDGSLRLRSAQGKALSVRFGEVRLRPVV